LSSTTQVVLSLSSGEAEFYATVKTASRLIAALAMVKELGVEAAGVLGTDSSASRGMASRRVAGKVRHIHTPALWLQQHIVRKSMKLRKLDGKKNGSDLGTKFMDLPTIRKCMLELGLEFREGPAPGALAVDHGV